MTQVAPEPTDPTPPEDPTSLVTQIGQVSSISDKLLNFIVIVAQVQETREIAKKYIDFYPAFDARFDNITNIYDTANGASWIKYWSEKVGSDTKTIKAAADAAGKLFLVVDAGVEAVQAYKDSKGNYSEAIQAGSVQMLAAIIAGEVGTVVGVGATALVVCTVGPAVAATGVATVAGIAIGIGTGILVEKGIKAGTNWVIDKAQNPEFTPPPGANNHAAASLTIDPTWSFNAETGEFKWLNAKAEARAQKVFTLLDIDPTPVGLKLYGDLYSDKRDVLLGHGGNDTMTAGKADDFMIGAGGRDKADGGKGADIIFGQQGADTLLGGNGNDTIFGGAGADRIYGGKGADDLIGEAGRDRFVYQSVKEIGGGFVADVILDFTRGKDKIDLSAIDADTTRAGNQAFTWKQLVKDYFSFDDGTQFAEVLADVNKDGDTDFQLILSNITKLTARDFIL